MREDVQEDEEDDEDHDQEEEDDESDASESEVPALLEAVLRRRPRLEGRDSCRPTPNSGRLPCEGSHSIPAR